MVVAENGGNLSAIRSATKSSTDLIVNCVSNEDVELNNAGATLEVGMGDALCTVGTVGAPAAKMALLTDAPVVRLEFLRIF